MGMKPLVRPKFRRAEPAGPTSRPVDALFNATQQRVLGLLFGHPERSFYTTELINLAGAGSGAAQRELVRLLRSGLITVRSIGNQRHYQANPDSQLFEDLCSVARKIILSRPRA